MTNLVSRRESRVEPDLVCVCCNCQRARVAPDEWREHDPRPGEQLTHGICPACLNELYPDIAPLVRDRVCV
jgi:hypothetical protein